MSRARQTVALAALLSLTWLTTACGGGSTAGDDASGGGKDTVRIAYQAFPSGDLIVKDQRWLEKALPGYRIDWTKFDSGASINTAFLAESVDIAAIGSSPVARGLSAPLNIPYKVTWVLDVAGDNEALVVRKDTRITSVKDLAGKKIATPFGSTSHYSLLAALKRAGLNPGEVDIVDLEPQDILAAWTRGDIDGAYIWLPTLKDLQKSGTTLTTSRELAKAGKPTLDLGVASNAFIDKHPDVLAAWRKAQARALDLITERPDEAAAAVGRQLGIPKAQAAEQLAQGEFLRPAELAGPRWIGTPGNVGELAGNLHDAAEFLHSQKQIGAVPEPATLEKAVYAEGLSDAVGS
ncbi:ABC transporter substrate-binding protein [Streptomyces sp. V4I23]|uniref:taurine ABC transporter substrate-binding protein n=1 Tax=Streptomyces sp. V4I23 TaxID=3042282 RepID=UPI0027D89CCB|nr:ABC transporter substrate-binding protein [Streptomyces sp. V4I23]